jgi:hypothetical protein
MSSSVNSSTRSPDVISRVANHILVSAPHLR